MCKLRHLLQQPDTDPSAYSQTFSPTPRQTTAPPILPAEDTGRKQKERTVKHNVRTHHMAHGRH